MMATATLSPILVVLFLAFMTLLGGVVQVTNPKKNPKKKAKKKKSKKKGKKKAKRSAAQKAASKRNIKKARAAKKKKSKKKPKKKAKKKKSKKRKKGKKKRKTTKRRTVTTTKTTKTNKKRKRKRKRKTTKKRKRKRKSNPKLKGFKKVKSYFPKMKGKVSVADGAGAFTGIVIGSSLSGLTKMATENPAAGVAVHGASWLGGTLIINNTKKLGKKSKREKFARGWFVGDGIAFGLDAGVEIFKYLTESPTAILKLSDLEDADWKDKIKTVFMTGVGNPLDVVKKGKSGDLSDYDDFDEFVQKLDPRNWSTEDLLDELYGYDDLSDDELALIAEVEELEGLGEYSTPTQEAASQVFV